jgi:hypothetical protein
VKLVKQAQRLCARGQAELAAQGGRGLMVELAAQREDGSLLRLRDLLSLRIAEARVEPGGDVQCQPGVRRFVERDPGHRFPQLWVRCSASTHVRLYGAIGLAPRLYSRR